ncbi:MAG: hypothetical protein ACOX8V_01865 [Thermoleophilia bacterium]|jgi:hypothetical protein
MKRLLRLDVIIVVFILASMIQYAQVAYLLTASGQAALWSVESDLLMSSGVTRYAKDVLLLIFSIGWVAALPRVPLRAWQTRLVRRYSVWLVIVMCLGMVPFLLGYSPLFFLPYGLRWIMLLHASFGLFILYSALSSNRHDRSNLFWLLLMVLAVNTVFVLLQTRHWSTFLGFAIGSSRLTGVFGQAGIAGFFAMGVALLAWLAPDLGWKRRVLIAGWCLFLALSSGTRFAALAIILLIAAVFWELLGRIKPRLRRAIKFIFLPLAVCLLFVSYQAIIEQVNRGDAITQQFQSGGRASTFVETVRMLSEGHMGELLIGRGLGVGTNTAVGQVLASGTPPSLYRFNILVDNSLLTAFFQFGLLGSIVFWFGWVAFVVSIGTRLSGQTRQQFVLLVFLMAVALFVGNLFEQYFLMIAFAVSLGRLSHASIRTRSTTTALELLGRGQKAAPAEVAWAVNEVAWTSQDGRTGSRGFDGAG